MYVIILKSNLKLDPLNWEWTCPKKKLEYSTRHKWVVDPQQDHGYRSRVIRLLIVINMESWTPIWLAGTPFSPQFGKIALWDLLFGENKFETLT